MLPGEGEMGRERRGGEIESFIDDVSRDGRSAMFTIVVIYI